MAVEKMAVEKNTKSLIEQGALIQKAEIVQSSDGRPRQMLRVTLDLTVARTKGDPLLLGDPFDSFYVEQAGTVDPGGNFFVSLDPNLAAKLSLISPERHTLDQYVFLRSKDFGHGKKATAGAVLTWPAQPPAQVLAIQGYRNMMVVVFFFGIDFQPGTINTIVSGRLFLEQAAIVRTQPVTVVGVAPVQLTVDQSFSGDATYPQRRTFSNLSRTKIAYLGDSSVTGRLGASPGIPIAPGGVYWTDNQGEFWGVTDTGSASIATQQEYYVDQPTN